MSNARYFADGVDFWRVIYEDGSTEGPYTSPVSAGKVGKNMIKLRQEYRGWGSSRVLYREYRIHESFKLQKLVPLARIVQVDHDSTDPLAIASKMEFYLDWEDWSV